MTIRLPVFGDERTTASAVAEERVPRVESFAVEGKSFDACPKLHRSNNSAAQRRTGVL